MPRRPALYPRPRWQWAEDLPDAETDWASLLLLNDVSFLTENQVSLWTSPEHPGVGRVRFYPVPRAPHLDSDRFDMNRIASESVHVLAGPSYEVFRHGELIALDVVEAMWLPSHIRRTLESPDIQITETISIYEDTVVIQVTPVGETAGLSIRWQASTERTRAASWRSYDHTQVCLHEDGVANGWVWLGSDVGKWETTKSQQCMAMQTPLNDQGGLMVLMLGYDQAAVERKLESLLAQFGDKSIPEIEAGMLSRPHDVWDWYFSHMVPRLAGGPEWIRRLYYYQMATHRINLLDIPYEPFTVPYTCPGKTEAIWQKSWNTGLNAITERWLNDPSWAESGVALIQRNGGALNIGASLHRLRRPRDFRDPYDYIQALSDAVKGSQSLPATARQFDWAFVMPYTAPLALHGIWEVFQRTGDEEFLRGHLGDMVEHERALSAHDTDGDGLVDYSGPVDEYERSPRWRSVIGDIPENSDAPLKFDRPLELVDINAQLCLLREDICRAASILGNQHLEEEVQARLEHTRDAINEVLWDDEIGCYRDVDATTHESTGVISIATFSALLAGVASADQAARMVEHLTDPAIFGSEFPVPSVALNTDNMESTPTGGSEILVTSGLWITIMGLVRYDLLDTARDLLWKALRMMGENGPTSACSYDSQTGKANLDPHRFSSQSAILSDLFLRYVVGFVPRADDIIECHPFALPREWDSLEFGPIVWRGDVDVTITWKRDEGYTVDAGGSKFTSAEPRRMFLGLDSDDSLIELTETSVKDHLILR